MTIRVTGSAEGETKSAADSQVRGAGAVCRDAATVSRCSCRHAANLLLTNKAGKQQAENDENEHEAEQHGGVRVLDRRESRRHCAPAIYTA